ncbi:MAG TPA: HlyD family efflux transporter periplasmic adaptor subunit, partial [Rhabdaerophilum sp.]|nr:HlyD family efflux transporter periplasmic adaptor subunit [Rhabdaerophilum sp.]
MPPEPQPPLLDAPAPTRKEHAQPDALPLVIRKGTSPVATEQPTASLPWRIFKVARFVPLLMALMLTGGVIGLYFQPPGVRKAMEFLNLKPGGGTSSPIAVPAPPGGKAQEAALPSQIVGLGKILPEGEVVTVAPPYGAGDARLAVLDVKEGDRVGRGSVLAVLDNEKQLIAALETAKANVAAKEAILAQVRAATTASRSEAEAALSRAETVRANAERDFERVEELRRRGFAADQTYDLRRTQRDEAVRETERLRATLSRFSGDIDAQPDVVVAARNLDSARADLDRATADLDKAYVRAPIDATVLSISARPGEKPGLQGIMNLGDIEHMKVEVEIYQTMIGRVTLGAPVEITAEALPKPLAGKVSRIGLEV